MMAFVEVGIFTVFAGALVVLYRIWRSRMARAVLVLRIENPDVMRVLLGPAGMAEMTAGIMRGLAKGLPHPEVAQSNALGEFRVAPGDLTPRQLWRYLHVVRKLCRSGVVASEARINPALSGVLVRDTARAESVETLYAFGQRALQRRGAEAIGKVSVITYRPQTAAMRAAKTQIMPGGYVKLRYRPRISADTGLIIAAEVEQSFLHPDLGVVTADEFLARLGLDALQSATSETVHCALTVLRRWQAAGASIERMTLHLSREQLAGLWLPDLLLWELDLREMPASSIGLVVSDGKDQRHDAITTDHIKRLALAGCAIEVDGFGLMTEGVELHNVKNADTIRIGRGFVRACDRAHEQQRMILAILAVAERYGLTTLALDVGTTGEQSFLTQIGVTCLQGDAISPLLSEEEMVRYLLRHGGVKRLSLRRA